MKTALIEEVDNTTRELLRLIAVLDHAQLNTVPFEGSWTAAQVAQHVFKSDELILKSLNGPGKPTSRPIDEGIQSIKETFLNFNTKLISPAEIVPESHA